MSNKRKYFGTDGIRGFANKSPMTAETAMKVGMAAGVLFRRRQDRHRVVIGKDTRLSGYMIENALVAGFTAAGMDVFQLGPVPTPAVAMLTRSLRADIGVMISASHNPYHDNGIKLFGPDGYKLSDKLEANIEELIDSDLSHRMAHSDKIGRAKRIDGIHDRYIEFAKRTLPRKMTLEGLRVVIDCANGAAYRVAPDALWEMGAEVVKIGVEPNGTNINAECGSTHTAALQRKVNEVRADIGIALDGDADRVIIVDENHVVQHMREHGYNVGGEQSGHIVLSDYATTGDGLVAALQVLSVVKSWDKPVSEVCKRFDAVPQILQNVRYSNGDPLADKIVKEAIGEGEERLANSGRLVIRASGTEPLIRVMAEGDDEGLIENVVNDIVGSLRKAAA